VYFSALYIEEDVLLDIFCIYEYIKLAINWHVMGNGVFLLHEYAGYISYYRTQFSPYLQPSLSSLSVFLFYVSKSKLHFKFSSCMGVFRRRQIDG
jgi:hypothetical protein